MSTANALERGLLNDKPAASTSTLVGIISRLRRLFSRPSVAITAVLLLVLVSFSLSRFSAPLRAALPYRSQDSLDDMDWTLSEKFRFQAGKVGPNSETPLRLKEVSNRLPWILREPQDELKACERIFLFKFRSAWGFASEHSLYTRAALIAKESGFTFIEDDTEWNYGRLSNFFEPRVLDCIPPLDWDNHDSSIHLGDEGWNAPESTRVWYDRARLEPLDDWARAHYLNQNDMKELLESNRDYAESKSRHILGEGDALPAALERIFKDQAAIVKEFWKVLPELQEQADKVANDAGLFKEPLLVPSEWAEEGGPKAWTSSGREPSKYRIQERMGAKAKGENVRGPIIGVHIRLGDKESEYQTDIKNMGITNTFGNLSVYTEAAHDAYRRLLPETTRPFSELDVFSFSPDLPPTLLIMSAEPGVLQRLSVLRTIDPFLLLQTPEPVFSPSSGGPALKSVRPKKEPMGYAISKPVAPPSKRALLRDKARPEGTIIVGGKMIHGYDQMDFNSLPVLERVIHTQTLVRDLVVMTTYADAFIVSGASNIGRLAMLITGTDGVVGPRDPRTGKGLGGRVRSVDGHFYPTAYQATMVDPEQNI